MMDAAKRFYVERHDLDRWIEELERAYADALIERANAETVRRQRPPDYDRLTPHDLMAKVETALRGES